MLMVCLEYVRERTLQLRALWYRESIHLYLLIYNIKPLTNVIEQEYYSSGLQITCVRCEGQRDRSCSAGNGMYGVTAGHFQSFGVAMGAAGCI